MHCNELLNPLSTANFSTETENQSHTNTTRVQVNFQWLFIIIETSITGFYRSFATPKHKAMKLPAVFG